MFDSDADRDMAILATTDLDIEPMYLDNRGPNWLVRGETELALVAACERQIGYLHAMQSRALARFADERPSATGQLVSEFAADEVALAAGWTRAVAGMRLSLAITLTRRLPATLTALERGEIDLRRAQKLADLTGPLSADLARQVEDAVLPQAAGQNTSELARATRTAIAHLDPTGAEERHQDRKQNRRVDLYPLDDAMPSCGRTCPRWMPPASTAASPTTPTPPPRATPAPWTNAEPTRSPTCSSNKAPPPTATAAAGPVTA